ncbi:MAG: hypothetical protein IT355_15750 [Gemmatimonadaceae bacterium]|nr:hypothetical protein [Gemmatimonadaceae bacterium]
MPYTVALAEAPPGHTIPPLLTMLGDWVRTQSVGSLMGVSSMIAEEIPAPWDEANAARLQRAGFAFLQLPDGSLLAWLEQAVVLLGSEGDRRTVANSLEDFLHTWAQGETGIWELDDDDGVRGRRALARWLKDHAITVPPAREFDFAAWLDGAPDAAPAPVAGVSRAPTPTLARLGPRLGAVAALVGLRADAPELVEYVTTVLKKKVPSSTSEYTTRADVSATKQGLELLFTHDLKNELYPPVQKTARSFVPYLARVWVRAAITEDVLGVPWGATDADAVSAVLGPPSGMEKEFATDVVATIPFWHMALDRSAQVALHLTFDARVRAHVAVETALSLEDVVTPGAALFIGYAATRGLLDESRFATQAGLLARVRDRGATGSELAAAAMPRGLWDSHLVDDAALRSLAYQWFHRLGDVWITADLIAVFGARKGPFGHDEPQLDADTWDAVDRATPVFDARFAAFATRRP